MNLKSFILLAIAVLFFTSIRAQVHTLGKVTIAELEEKKHPLDPSAKAAILFKTGESITKFINGFVSTTEVKTKIKIYTKEGLDKANQSIWYYSGGSVSVTFSDAVTWNLVDGKIVKTKLKSDGIFEEKLTKNISVKKAAFPNVKEGSIIEFSYTLQSNGYSIPSDWDFQTTIPVNYCEYKTYIPQYFVYKKKQKGYIFPRVSEETINNQAGYYETVTTYVAENFPAIKSEPYVDNLSNYVSSITHELATIDVPRSTLVNISTTWENITKEIYKMDDFGLELHKKDYFEEDIKKVLIGLTSRDDKILAILKYVKNNIKWNNYYGYTCDVGVKKAYANKVGNVAEINLMLTAMLRYAEIDASPILISTRSNGISLFPSRTAFNYVIAAVEIQDNLILLDATDPFSQPNVLPIRDLNWNGRLIRDEGSSTEVSLTPKTISRNSSNLIITCGESGIIKGKLRSQINNHYALEFRQKNKDFSEDAYLEDIESSYNSIVIETYSRDNFNEIENPIIETYTFEDKNNIEIIDKKIYFSPMLFLGMKENPFKQEKREYPVNFGYPFEKKFNINITIPKGYSVESLPKSVNLDSGEDVATFKYFIGNTENQIQISAIFKMNFGIIPFDFYEDLKDFYQKVVDKENEKIVLYKI